MMRKRVALWDNLKFLLILLVVIGHFMDEYSEKSRFFQGAFLFIYSFHMPAFFFISGLFHKNSRIKEKVVGYLSLGFVYKLCVSLIGLYYGEPTFNLLSTAAIPWFMFVMAAFIGITYLLRDYNLPYILGLWILLSLAVGYDSKVGDYLMLSRIMVFYPYYLTGVLIGSERMEDFLRARWLKFIAPLILGLAVFLCVRYLDDLYIYRMVFAGRYSYEKMFGDDYVTGISYRLIAYLVTSLMMVSVMSLIPRKNLGIITEFGKRTLPVYFWHRLVLHIMSQEELPVTICSGSPFGEMAWVLVAVCLTLLLCHRFFGIFPAWCMQAPLRKRQKR